MNKVFISGYLTKDPELRHTPNGTPLTNFVIGVNRPPNKDGSRTSDFINIVAWNKTAEIVVQYLRKGSYIIVAGKLQSHTYEKDDERRTVWEVIADEVDFGPRVTTPSVTEEVPGGPATPVPVAVQEQLAPVTPSYRSPSTGTPYESYAQPSITWSEDTGDDPLPF